MRWTSAFVVLIPGSTVIAHPSYQYLNPRDERPGIALESQHLSDIFPRADEGLSGSSSGDRKTTLLNFAGKDCTPEQNKNIRRDAKDVLKIIKNAIKVLDRGEVTDQYQTFI